MDNRICPYCLQPLIYIPVNQHYRVVCDNDRCYLFREGQGVVPRDNNGPREKPKKLPLTLVIRPNRNEYNREGVANYRFARSLDIPSVVARDLRHKSKKEIERAAKELVRVLKSHAGTIQGLYSGITPAGTPIVIPWVGIL